MPVPKGERYVEIEEFAKSLCMTNDELIRLLREDGYIIGNTQSKEARRLRMFFVDQCGALGSGGLLHKTKFRIRITPKGQQLLSKRYGTERRP